MRTHTLFLVHAHPDDESVVTGGVILRAKAAGHRVVVVTCTAGEEGEIHNLAPSLRPRLGAVRTGELREACTILGVDRLELLGYRDSGMAGAAANDHPRSLSRARIDEVAARLVLLLRAERPEVVVTYTPDGTYGHPDHRRAHDATVAALRVLRREGWSPWRVFWHAMPRSAVERLGDRAHPAMRDVGVPDREVTTAVDVRDLLDRKLAAVGAHVSQLPRDPAAGLVGQFVDAMGGFEHFVLAAGAPCGGAPAADLFAAPAATAAEAAAPAAAGARAPRPVP